MAGTVERVDGLVIGAGVIGLAVARALALRGLEVVVLERERAIGTGISSRNSEVIHAGLYYPQGSLKARLCVRGRELLYAYAADRGVPHQRCGKLIVATSDEQQATLERLKAAGDAHGVADLSWLSATQAQALEPQLHCVAALHSGSTGVVDSHALMLALQGDLEQAGGWVALGSPVLSGECGPQGITLQVGGAEPMAIQADWVVNSAGLDAQAVAGSLGGLAPQHIPPLHLAKGHYFSLSGRSPFSRLIYPVPEPGGLGVHLTLDLAGQARFGPDVEWVTQRDFAVDPSRQVAFEAAVRRYWPGLPEGALQPAYAGIRPKLSGPGEPARDFLIQGEAEHGVKGLIQLLGMESPGLTSALAIAERVQAMI